MADLPIVGTIPSVLEQVADSSGRQEREPLPAVVEDSPKHPEGDVVGTARVSACECHLDAGDSEGQAPVGVIRRYQLLRTRQVVNGLVGTALADSEQGRCQPQLNGPQPAVRRRPEGFTEQLSALPRVSVLEVVPGRQSGEPCMPPAGNAKLPEIVETAVERS